MSDEIIYGLITKETPTILVVGTDESEVRKKIDENVGALFKCNFDCSVISFSELQHGFEPTEEHYRQVRIYVSLMLKNKNLPVCEVNLGSAKVVS